MVKLTKAEMERAKALLEEHGVDVGGGSVIMRSSWDHEASDADHALLARVERFIYERDHPLVRIHVNQHLIKANKKDGGKRPVISVIRRGRTIRAEDVVVSGKTRIVYRPEKPLSCGATVWIETRGNVRLTVSGEVVEL